tara:strand:- start:451 stop:3234 length:2784 start_codon:yes stop_codon:yes gene_type:complete
MSIENAEITKIDYNSDSIKIYTSKESQKILYDTIIAIDNGEIEENGEYGSLGTVLGSLVGIATGDITGIIGGGVGGWLISKFIPNKKINFLTISLEDEEMFSFISSDANKYAKQIEDRFNAYLFNSVKGLKEKSDVFNLRLATLIKEKDNYISHSQVYGDDYKDQTVSLNKYGKNNKILSEQNLNLLREIKNNFKTVELERKEFNKKYILHNFNNPYLSKLIPSQKKAVLIDEDNTLINAGAGSGKTYTLISKILFLLDKKLCQPEEILVLAYNANVREELMNRIKKAAKKPNLKLLEKIADHNIHTFHSYGLKFLKEKKTSKILDKVSSFEDELIVKRSADIDEIINSLTNDNSFRVKLLSYLSHYFTSYRDYFEDIHSFNDYVKHIRNIGQISLKGDFMRSFEEVEIANYLYLNGINYEYEAEYKGVYEKDKGFTVEDLKIKNHLKKKEKAKTYHPDFYLPDYDIYIEHFALDESNNAPIYFKDPILYVEQYKEKVEVHKRNKTKLIKTFSWMKKKAILINELENSLKHYHVRFNPLNDEERLKKFKEKGKVSHLNQLIAMFMHHIKSNELNLDNIKKKVFNINEPLNQNRAVLFLDIFEKIFNFYQANLVKDNAIDFDDMIVLSREKITNENFKYVLVDEFQDISRARAKLLKKIKEENNCKLFCVGDDWQAIYRFVGGDISIFTKTFIKHFGYFERANIDTTFRYGENINNVSSGFIQKNPEQLTKSVNTRRSNPKGDVCVYDLTKFKDIISKYAFKKEQIYILGRNNLNSYNSSFQKRYPKRNIVTKVEVKEITGKFDNVQYKTIHKSKGLEADHIFIINLFSGTKGFPSQKSDDEILSLVHSNIDSFEFAEERRLMYVALTRARKSVHLFSGSDWACSDFVKEIIEDYPHNIRSFLKTNIKKENPYKKFKPYAKRYNLNLD